jgi:two-component system heavy metal sensor histidine kinase CusS
LKTPVSLTARLSLLFAFSTACVLLAAGFMFERAVEKQFHKHDMEELGGKMDLIRGVLGNITSYEAVKALQPQLRNAVVAGHPDITTTVVDGNGNVLFTVGQANVVKLLLESSGAAKTGPVTMSLDNHTYRIATNRLALGIPASQPANVAISLDITSDQEFIDDFRLFLWLGIGLCALAMGLLGWMTVRKGLAPLHDVSTTLANVSTSRLDKPISSTGVPRELQELISAFNRMLARLDDSFRRLSEFSSDIAHELRTPINNMMMHTQVALSRERDAGEYRENLLSNLEELNRLSRIISDMLFLAKADNSLVVPKLEKVDLRAEVAKLLDFFQISASERRVRLVQSGEATVFGDRLMLQRALSNLLSNAMRFTPEGMSVEVSIGKNDGRAMVAIANPGPEIPAEQLPKIFGRLYRVDASRREGNTENAGLGLAITKSIVEIHGGDVSAESANGRTCFTITLPTQQLA